MAEVKQIQTKQNGSAANCIGNADQRLADARKFWLQEEGGTTIVAAFDTASLSVSANWEAPFEGMTPGGVLSTVGSVAQAVTSNTMISTQSTTQVWKGNQPVEIEAELMFYALRDPVAEVMKPLHFLECLIAPDSANFIGVGSIAKPLTLKIGKAAIYTDLILTSVSMPFDKETDSKGNFVRAKVNVNLRTKTMVDKEMLKKENGIRTA